MIHNDHGRNHHHSQEQISLLILQAFAICIIGILGLLAVFNGFIPFSPSFLVSYPVSSACLYLSLLTGVYLFEASHSPFSVRPSHPDDPQLFYHFYLLSSTLWSIGLVPMSFLSMGRAAILGSSTDQLIHDHFKLLIALFLGAFFVYKLRKKAIDEKDLHESNRKSPPIQDVPTHFEVMHTLQNSDVWDVISMTDQELEAISSAQIEAYKKKRSAKVKRESNQRISYLSNQGFSLFNLKSLTGTQEEIVEDEQVMPSAQDDGSSSPKQILDSLLPGWHQAQSRPTPKTSPRSFEDFDTRYDQSVVPNHQPDLTEAELLALDPSERPTTPPQGVDVLSENLDVISDQQDSNPQIVDQQVKTLIQTEPVYDEEVSSQHSPSYPKSIPSANSIERINFSSLNTQHHTQIGFAVKD